MSNICDSHIGVPPITQVTHVPDKNSNIQGRCPNVVKNDFPYKNELLLKYEVFFKRRSHYEKGRN